MAKYIKTRKGNDGFYYPYTSPDLVIDEDGKSATTKFNEINTQLENIGQSTQEQINTSIDKAIEDGKMHSDASKLSIIDENNNFMSDNVEGALEELSTQVEDIANKLENVVTYTPEDGDGDFITAENIAFSNENFTATNVKGAITELFQSASNGKTLIANAITGKGVATNANDSFQTMATNISNIATNSSIAIESGSFTPEEALSSYTITTNNPCTNFILVCTQISNPDAYRFMHSIIFTPICNMSIGSNSSGNAVIAINTTSTVCTFDGNNISMNVGDSKLMTCEYRWLAW